MSFPFLDFESSFFTNEELLFLAGASGGGVEYTIINNPATFTTDLAKPFRRLVIPFTPVQSGSGDPSPDNIRPITGWTGVNIYRSGEDTSDPLTIPVSWQTEAGTVYGGALDALTGVLTVERASKAILWGDVTKYPPGDSMTTGYITLDYDTKVAGESGASNEHKCNSAIWVWSGEANTTPHFYVYRGSNGKCIAAIILPNGTDEDLNIVIVSKLKEPYTVQLDPVTLSTLIGENVVWTDTNGDNTIGYLKKT